MRMRVRVCGVESGLDSLTACSCGTTSGDGSASPSRPSLGLGLDCLIGGRSCAGVAFIRDVRRAWSVLAPCASFHGGVGGGTARRAA